MVVPPALFAPRAAAAITSPRPPVTTVQPRSASRRPTSSARCSCSRPLPITATWIATAAMLDLYGPAGTRRHSDPRRRLCRQLRREAAEGAGRDDRQPGELHALRLDAARGGVRDARAARAGRAAADYER